MQVEDSSILTRFAPSPTGLLHLGHAYAAQQAFSLGPCLLRIEDIDHTRSKPELIKAIYEDLRWLGFDWPEPVRIQSAHKADYDKVVQTLNRRGLLYEDYTSRTGREDQSRPPSLKLSIEKSIRALGTDQLSFVEKGKTIPIDLTIMDDKTVARRDIETSYDVAVTHDDQAQNITHVCRGQDLFHETGTHVLLQTLMGWRVPHYHHHDLVMDNDDRKMSKRRGSMTLRALRKAGHSPKDVLAMAHQAI